jgi:hypothetical protein
MENLKSTLEATLVKVKQSQNYSEQKQESLGSTTLPSAGNGSSSVITILEQALNGKSGTEFGHDGCETTKTYPLASLQEIQAADLARLKEIAETASKTYEAGKVALLEKIKATKNLKALDMIKYDMSTISLKSERLNQFVQNMLSTAGGMGENTREMAKLMFHYPQAYSLDGLEGSELEMMREIKKQVLRDWADDIAEFPLWVVKEAAKEHRRASKFRPSISEFRERCEKVLNEFKMSYKTWGNDELGIEYNRQRETIEKNNVALCSARELAASGGIDVDALNENELDELRIEKQKMEGFGMNCSPKYFTEDKFRLEHGEFGRRYLKAWSRNS